ncbi:hypothetical protein B0T14DRAFT_584029 [Immersiella caudata]|uniref:3-hydroxyacyl-CoA dehydrogenase NAD binding domain-containing protein n=1 Tax=Immersiella caudata TaxID=314043 RepID=A0AA40BZ67_9PEZI|nr:hypothetical protein B0T14DRAFT_584029 [Immersiella caudata]
MNANSASSESLTNSLYKSPSPSTEPLLSYQPRLNLTHINTSTMTWTRPTISGRLITILGAGVLGRRIATVFVAGGYAVHIRDPSPDARSDARSDALAFISANHAHFVSELNPTKSITPGLFRSFEDLESAVKYAWLVIEAVPEKLELKVNTFGGLDRKAPRDCIFGSNNSSFQSGLTVGKVGEQRKGLVCNVQFTMPPGTRTVELR